MLEEMISRPSRLMPSHRNAWLQLALMLPVTISLVGSNRNSLPEIGSAQKLEGSRQLLCDKYHRREAPGPNHGDDPHIEQHPDLPYSKDPYNGTRGNDADHPYRPERSKPFPY